VWDSSSETQARSTGAPQWEKEYIKVDMPGQKLSFEKENDPNSIIIY
jgi:hypothetical protein